MAGTAAGMVGAAEIKGEGSAEEAGWAVSTGETVSVKGVAATGSILFVFLQPDKANKSNREKTKENHFICKYLLCSG
ncbi:MAG: hypothetical protein J6S50_01425 [Oscillospiraceae bacterium]|nr:hypothetical protein [Oscillospiraceae bacterium]